MKGPKAKDPDLNDVLKEGGTEAVLEMYDRALVVDPSKFNSGCMREVNVSDHETAHQDRAVHERTNERTDGEYNVQVARLAALDPVDYDRQRKAAAERLGCRITTLDAAVKAARAAPSDLPGAGQGRPLSLFEPIPWDEAVDGSRLLDEMVYAIRRFVVLSEHEARAVALWVVHTHAYDIWTISPRLSISSAEKGCGKTTLLDVTGCLVPRPLPTSNITAAAVYRTIELARPTMLVDEGDTFMGDNEDLRGILNSGHRKGGCAVRLVGDNHEPRQFATYTPVAIALIGSLHETLADRSVPIRLQRRRPDEEVGNFRSDRAEDLAELARKAARWVRDNTSLLAAADPDTAGLFNRVADNWRPLFAIADVAGGGWPARARDAAKKLTAAAAPALESLGTMVLADIQALFEQRGADRLTSKEIVEHLHTLEDRPWVEYGRTRKPITQAGLARLLRRYHIAPVNMRANGGSPQKGYFLKSFQGLFERYLPPLSTILSATPKHHQQDQQDAPDSDPLHEQPCSNCQ